MHQIERLINPGLRHGFIVANEDDRMELESMNIILGEFKDGVFTDCVVPKSAFEQLSLEWGRFFWSLTEVHSIH